MGHPARLCLTRGGSGLAVEFWFIRGIRENPWLVFLRHDDAAGGFLRRDYA
jgi:hypothetical protein